ncbi:potassium transporter [Desulfobacterales bacterium HSG17]|nr:potassium transporter [Desulfobacterales bacterium HSG17]
MKKIWVIGIGRFGLLAVDRLSKKYKHAHFVLADSENKKFELIQHPNCTLEQTDGVKFLCERLNPDNAPDWIIPSIPVHLAAEWCLCSMGADKIERIDIPYDIEPELPNPMRGKEGDIYVTHALFLCPDNCNEPENICTVTKAKRKPNMFDLLENIKIPGFQSLVIQSHQLAPGVGGLKPSQLFDLKKKLDQAQGKLLISTARRCHGVVTGLMKK